MPALIRQRPAAPPAAVPLETLEKRIDPRRLPRHVAIIMDGNGRWAQKRGRPRLWGHRAGAESVRAVVRAAAELGIGTLTLYAFSTENWQRPSLEVQGLMRLLVHTLRREAAELNRSGVRLRAVGRLDGLPLAVRRALERTERFLSANTGLRLNLALNYGGRQEIVDAARALAESGTPITEESLSSRLSTAPAPDPDLVVRTSGEFRLSNFLLWQSAYAEFYVTPTLWPDFRRRDLVLAVLDYQRRERRFGAA